jgi:hypothetical protein
MNSSFSAVGGREDTATKDFDARVAAGDGDLSFMGARTPRNKTEAVPVDPKRMLLDRANAEPIQNKDVRISTVVLEDGSKRMAAYVGSRQIGSEVVIRPTR